MIDINFYQIENYLDSKPLTRKSREAKMADCKQVLELLQQTIKDNRTANNKLPDYLIKYTGCRRLLKDFLCFLFNVNPNGWSPNVTNSVRSILKGMKIRGF